MLYALCVIVSDRFMGIHSPLTTISAGYGWFSSKITVLFCTFVCHAMEKMISDVVLEATGYTMHRQITPKSMMVKKELKSTSHVRLTQSKTIFIKFN